MHKGHTGKSQGQPGGRESGEKMQTRAFVVVSVGRKKWGRVKSLRIASFGWFQWALSCGGCLVVWHLDPGWLENLIHLSWWTVSICMEEDGTALKNKTDHVEKLVKRFTQQIFIDHKWHGQWCAMLWGLTGLPTAWTWPLGAYSLVEG